MAGQSDSDRGDIIVLVAGAGGGAAAVVGVAQNPKQTDGVLVLVWLSKNL